MNVSSRQGLELARANPREQERIADLMRLVPAGVGSALDVGAREGYLSRQLAERVTHVTALDLEMPDIVHERVSTVIGDATALEFEDGRFDLVLCSEVLEHIPQPGLGKACREIARVSRRFVLIGVPFQQDIRVGRTTCGRCGAFNPPYGHQNSFSETTLQRLFSGMRVARKSFVGVTRQRTNAISAYLNDLAGNPWGTYDQDELCIRCNGKLQRPAHRTAAMKMAGKVAHILTTSQRRFMRDRPNWIHVLFEK